MTHSPTEPAPPETREKENPIEANRLEAFSDGVLAIIITIMVLEIKAPHEPDLSALCALVPTFLGYALSFANVGIYWNNHHHLLRRAKHIDGRVMWANLNLLFWLSLFPFVTSWMGEHYEDAWPTACYGIILLLAALSYSTLQATILRLHGKDSALARSLGRDFKGKLSILLYICAIGLAFVNHWLSDGLFLIVAIMWFIPDRRLQ